MVQNTDKNTLVEHINCLVPPVMSGRLNIKGNEMMPIMDTKVIAVEENVIRLRSDQIRSSPDKTRQEGKRDGVRMLSR